MERRTQDLPTSLLIFVCPTRVLFERSFVKRTGLTIIGWTGAFLLVNLTFLFSLLWLHQHLRCWLLPLLWAIPFSRIFEIGYQRPPCSAILAIYPSRVGRQLIRESALSLIVVIHAECRMSLRQGFTAA